MKLHYSKQDMGFEYGQRSLHFTLFRDSEVRVEFSDPNKTDLNGNIFRATLYMTKEEQKALIVLLKKFVSDATK